MAVTWESRRLRNEKEVDSRLIEDMVGLGEQAGRLVLARATVQRDGRRVVPIDRETREQLSREVWGRVVKPYFIGGGDEALVGPEPQSPYTRLMVGGIRQAMELTAERHVQIVQRIASPGVRDWLMAVRPIGEQGGGGDRRPWYDPFHLFVYRNSPYRLSDRVWNTAIETRANIDAVMAYHIQRGTAAVDIADLLVKYLKPTVKNIRTRTPYGVQGSYAARRLARTEVTAAAGRSMVNAAIANPFVEGVKWNLSPSHPKTDNCDNLAAGGPAGDGVYDPRNVPNYPDHPHCVTPGQLVHTARGFIPIEDIVAGDKVMTHEGRFRRVNYAWHTPCNDTVYEIVTSAGTIELTGEHPVLIERGWVNAEDVKPGDKVLYTGVNVGFDSRPGVANSEPAKFSKEIVSDSVPCGIMPIFPVALNRDLAGDKCEIDKECTDGVFFNSFNAPAEQCFIHQGFDVGHAPVLERAGTGTTEIFRSVGLFDREESATIATFFDNTGLGADSPVVNNHFLQAGIIELLGTGNLQATIEAAGRVIIAGDVPFGIKATEQIASLLTTGAIVLFPGEGNTFGYGTYGDTTISEHLAQHAVGDGKHITKLRSAEAASDVEVEKQVIQLPSGLLFDAYLVPFENGKAMCSGVFGVGTFEEFATDRASEIELHDNLSVLSLGAEGGTAPRNAGVMRVANPHQALPYYSAVSEVRERHYTGPVYNMEVEGDNSYTVNGACVHNCLCYLTPALVRDAGLVNQQLEVEIEARTERAVALRGAFNLNWLVNALFYGYIIGVLEEVAEGG